MGESQCKCWLPSIKHGNCGAVKHSTRKSTPGSSDEDESEDESEDDDEIATLDIDDDRADDEVPLPLQIPRGYTLNPPPAALTAALVKQTIVLRLVWVG